MLAAAIRGRVDVIVTYNTKDFPPESCSKYGIDVQHPDEFINHLLHLNDSKVMSTIKAMRSRLRKPVISARELLDTFEQANLVQTASYLRKYEDLI